MVSPPPTPSKVIAMHMGYRSRAAERGKTPLYPSYFLKPVSTLAGSGDPVTRPNGCELLAFEGEIALIIGRRAHRIDPAEGWAHVGWVTAANDFGVYDLRYADGGSNLRSKGIDGFTPIGPEYIPAADVCPGDLRIRTWVNDELAQDAATKDELIFDFGTIVADLARLMTLEPGDVILTGTPTGSTVVVPGDVVEVEVTVGQRTSGRLRSPIVQSDLELAGWGAMPRVDDASVAAAHGASNGASHRASHVAGQVGGHVAEDESPVEEPCGDPLADRYDAATRAGLDQVSTATLASQLKKRGLEGCIFDGLTSTRPQRRLVGFARTVSYLPLRQDLFPARSAGLNPQKRAVEDLRAGDVLVIGARNERNAGTIGDILALRAQALGAAGIITDGAVRDYDAVAALDIPTYCAGHHPAVLGRHHVPWQTDIAIACAGVLVEPGDLIVGDSDGVVLLPDAIVIDIVADAVEQERQERFIAERVRAGSSVDGLYPMNDRWQREYEAWTEGEPSR